MSERTETRSDKGSTHAKNVAVEEQHAITTTDGSISSTTLEDNEKAEAARPSVASKDEPSGAHVVTASFTHEKHEWHETLLRLGPLSGLAAFAIAILSICASLGVLAGSNHAIVDTWPTPPSTYIAIFTAISNVAMRYAAIQGAIVGWWTRALRDSSIRDLHMRWRAGTSFHGALIAGKDMGGLGVASIVSCIVIVLDGPLLQRASTVGTEMHQGAAVSLQTAMYPEIPTDYTGALFRQTGSLSPAFNDTIPTPNDGSIPNDLSAGGPSYFSAVLRVWASEKPLPGIVSGCPDKCSAKIIAPALAPVACSRRSIKPSYSFANDLTTSFDGQRAPPLDHDHFIIDTSIDVSGESEKINSVIMYVPTNDCSDDIQMEVCSLQSAVGEYEITIENDKVTLNSAHPRIVRMAKNSAPNSTLQTGGYYPSTLGGIVSAAHLIWDLYVYVAKWHGFVNVGGAGAHKNLLFQKGTYNETECPAWYDPTDEYRAALNTLMVYMGSQASHGLGHAQRDQLDPGLPINPTITGHIEGTRSVFHTDYLWFAGAAVVELACICLIAPTYWGWWKIGRAVSFSPLEMASAFEAPMLNHVNSNSTGVEIARACSDEKVQYGSLNARYRGTKLAFSHPDASNRPKRGELIEL